MSDTPRTDAAWKPDGGDGYPTVDVDLARQLERELNAANERIKHLKREIELFREHADYGDMCLVEAILKGEEIGRKENQDQQ